MKLERRQSDKKTPTNEKEESLLRKGKFVAKSNSVSFGPRQPAWKAGTLPTELLPQNHIYFSLKTTPCQRRALGLTFYHAYGSSSSHNSGDASVMCHSDDQAYILISMGSFLSQAS